MATTAHNILEQFQNHYPYVDIEPDHINQYSSSHHILLEEINIHLLYDWLISQNITTVQL